MANGLAGIESHIVSPAEAKEIHPLMNVDDLVGAIHTPSVRCLPLAGRFFVV
jgi:sarcosine dehydrogenase